MQSQIFTSALRQRGLTLARATESQGPDNFEHSTNVQPDICVNMVRTVLLTLQHFIRFKIGVISQSKGNEMQSEPERQIVVCRVVHIN